MRRDGGPYRVHLLDIASGRIEPVGGPNSAFADGTWTSTESVVLMARIDPVTWKRTGVVRHSLVSGEERLISENELNWIVADPSGELLLGTRCGSGCDEAFMAVST